MHLKALFLTAAIVTVPTAALAETCSTMRFRDKGLELAREAYPQLVARDAEWTFTREELVNRRDKERTCAGREALDYLLLLADVQKAELPEAVAAMGQMLRAESPALEKKTDDGPAYRPFCDGQRDCDFYRAVAQGDRELSGLCWWI